MSDPALHPLIAHEWMYAVVECVHVVSIALSIGTIALVDLRLVGLGVRRQPAARLLHDTAVWTLTGIALGVASGLTIFTTDPLRYFHHPTFRLKMLCLAAAIAFNYTVHRRVALSVAPGVFGPVAGSVSLLLWATVVYAGLFYAFT